MSHPAVLTGRIMRLIAERLKSEVRSGRTILVITHDRELIESCCDRPKNTRIRSETTLAVFC